MPEGRGHFEAVPPCRRLPRVDRVSHQPRALRGTRAAVVAGDVRGVSRVERVRAARELQGPLSMCSRVNGTPRPVAGTSIASAIRPLPRGRADLGVAPELPMQTSGHSSHRRASRSRLSCMCQTGRRASRTATRRSARRWLLVAVDDVGDDRPRRPVLKPPLAPAVVAGPVRRLALASTPGTRRCRASRSGRSRGRCRRRGARRSGRRSSGRRARAAASAGRDRGAVVVHHATARRVDSRTAGSRA
jgi:hypothetical protein